ncbi:MAG: 50S ribosomal protein L5 [Archaeoglobaceae archaeon]|nr:50S ribosomal protein L5 [Archaeoglobaceae archaeon]MDW7989625.1 50S ribosomal protein L5 [Archaeoglobaceae archaeon]
MLELKAKENPMKEILLEKVVINLGIGQSGEKIQKGMKMLEKLLNQKPATTIAKKTIKNFGVRKKETIGLKLTLRGDRAMEFLKRALKVKEMRLNKRSINAGNFSFGIPEHIDLPGVDYDPEIGIFGMDICASLKRKGYRVAERRIARSKVGKKHRITKEDTIKWLENIGVIVE